MKTIVLALVAFASCVFAQGKPQTDKYCETEVNRKSSAALLAAMDYDLNQIEHGGNPCGSFTDYFAVNASDAIAVGAARKDVDARIARLIVLAEKKVYLSGYEAGLAKDGGTARIKQYMDDELKYAAAAFVASKTDAYVPAVPDWVQARLASMKAGKPVKCFSTFGHGTGVYHLTEGHDIPFYWYSFSNSDGWEQIALTTRVYGYDRRSIQVLRDQLNRPFESWSSRDITWIGLTNDLWVKDDLQAKYMHVGKVTQISGGTSGEYVYHRAELTHDYLDRITAATGGHLRFTVIE